MPSSCEAMPSRAPSFPSNKRSSTGRQVSSSGRSTSAHGTVQVTPPSQPLEQQLESTAAIFDTNSFHSHACVSLTDGMMNDWLIVAPTIDIVRTAYPSKLRPMCPARLGAATYQQPLAT